jgi:hypothetical protein
MATARIGLIVEGQLEERVLRRLLLRHLRERAPRLPEFVVGRVIPDGGGRVRAKDWVSTQVQRLRLGNHRFVLVVPDQETHASPDAVRKRLHHCGADAVFVASPKFERWLLGDADAVHRTLGKPRPSNWRSRDPLEVLRALKPGYKKMADGTLLADASRAMEWARAEPEFCALLRRVEEWLGLGPTACVRARSERLRAAGRGD